MVSGSVMLSHEKGLLNVRSGLPEQAPGSVSDVLVGLPVRLLLDFECLEIEGRIGPASSTQSDNCFVPIQALELLSSERSQHPTKLGRVVRTTLERYHR